MWISTPSSRTLSQVSENGCHEPRYFSRCGEMEEREIWLLVKWDGWIALLNDDGCILHVTVF